MSDADLFLDLLWPIGPPDGEVILVSWQRPGANVPISAAFEDWLPCDTEGANVWLNVASRTLSTQPDDHATRGGVADCRSIPALWCDLDVIEGAEPGTHKGTHVFETWAEAFACLDRMPVAPNLIVNTGNGLSGWWLLDEPVDVETGQMLLNALAATLERVTDGRADPSVFEVARMMRLPGTLNHKSTPPKPVTLDVRLRSRWSASELFDHLDLPKPQVEVEGSSVRLGGGIGRPGDDYNASCPPEDVVTMLVNAGCEIVEVDGRGVTKLARPDKGTRSGLSLTVGWVGPNVTYCWTDGFPPLEARQSYTPFRLRAALLHGGDYASCARELAGMGYGARTEPLAKLPQLDGLHVAETFVAELAGDAIYVGGIGWHLWDSTRFVEDGEGHALTRRGMSFVKSLVARAAVDLKDCPEEGKKAAAADLKRATSYMEWGPIGRLLEFAAVLLSTPAKTLDADPELLNVANGVLNLRTLELTPHDPKHRMTKRANAAYLTDAVTADWSKALSSLGPEMVDYLQVCAGLSAIGRSEGDLVMIAYGEGGNGKGTVLGAMAHALGDYTYSPKSKLFTGQGHDTQELMPFRGARMAMSAETEEDHFLNMERLKALSGGDPITDRHLYARSFVTWEPTHNLWLQTNHRPRIRNTDAGTWRRLQLVPFTGEFGRGAQGVDAWLRDRLRADPANRAAVLSWIVQGAARWLREPVLPFCPVVDMATAQWRQEEDIVASFLVDAGLEITGRLEHDWIAGSDLYTKYRDAALAGGQRPYANSTFAREMLRYAGQLKGNGEPSFESRRVPAGVRWYGIRRAGEGVDIGASYPVWRPDPILPVDNPPEEDTDGPPW